MKKTFPIIIAVIVLIGVGSFYGGMKYGQKKTTVPARGNFQNFQGQAGANGAGTKTGRANGSGFVAGRIIAQDEKSITVQLGNLGQTSGQGGSKIVFFSNATEVGKFVNGAISDLKVGETVSVTGQTNADGSMTAQSIQIRPVVAIPNAPAIK